VRLDGRQVRALLLIGWSGFLFYLWRSGEIARYLGPRTQWLAPVGAIALGVVGLASGLMSTVPWRGRVPLGRRDGLGLIAMLVPILAGILFTGTQLGALAASSKLTSSRGIDPAALAHLGGKGESANFLQVSVAEKDRSFAAQNDLEPGRAVTVTGFVAAEPSRAGASFSIARFYITCCIADAVPISIRIAPRHGLGIQPRKNDWVSVAGVLRGRPGHLVVWGRSVRDVAAPHQPYLNFQS
jgi:uncharacterized repeat protein (TIGR03943 family)